ncbi:MAG: ComEC/Rec2 family competence protein [Blastocatellia bacterium]
MMIFWVLGLWWLLAPWLPVGGSNSGNEVVMAAPRPLEIDYIDVEGGAATLIITPAGESILIDAGWPGFEDRDAKRIEAALQKAGLRAIDHLIITHYHTDHYGGVPALAKRVPIRQAYDHGPMNELTEDRDFARKYAAYQEAIGGRSTTLRPGSSIRLKSLPGTAPVTLRCLAARGEVVSEPRMAAAPNRYCKEATSQPPDPSDNARSLVLQLRYGSFDFLDTGDLTWNIEQQLVCPQNMIGEIDLFQVGHHEQQSGPAAQPATDRRHHEQWPPQRWPPRDDPAGAGHSAARRSLPSASQRDDRCRPQHLGGADRQHGGDPGHSRHDRGAGRTAETGVFRDQ